jgi:hypothetical protein
VASRWGRFGLWVASPSAVAGRGGFFDILRKSLRNEKKAPDFFDA